MFAGSSSEAEPEWAVDRRRGPRTRPTQFSGKIRAARLEVDLGALPTPGGPVQVQAGETWHFQFWHRDVVSSNFTDAIAVTFQ